MKRYLVLFCSLLILLFPTIPVKASANSDTLEQLYEQSGMEQAVDTLDEQTLQLLSGLGIDPKDALALLDADLSALPGMILQMIKAQSKKPLGMLAAILAMLLLAVCLQGISEKRLATMPQDMLYLLLSAGIFGEQTVLLMRQLSAVFDTLGAFMQLFLPAFAGVMAASGQTASAIGMQALTFGAAELITALMSEIILPCLFVYLALCMLCAANDLFDVEQITKTVSGISAWILGVSMSLFTIVLGVQRMIASAADSLGMKTAKFALSTLVPVVGGQLSEALSSVTACFTLLSSSFGSFALVAVMVLFLPVTVSLVWMLAVLKIAQLAAALFHVEGAKRMYAALSSGFGLLLGVTLCAFCAMIIALALLWSAAG